MRSHVLRRIRIVVSAVIFFCFFMIFIDLRHVIPEEYFNELMYLQFVPSFMKFLSLKNIAAAGFIFILLLTFITGRTYCSFLCPLGIAQDILSRLGGRLRKKFRRYGYKRPFTVIRYLLLAAVLVVTVVWGLYAVTLLDPYSIFGRIMTFFIKPVIVVLNNFLAGILGKFDIYNIVHFPVTGFRLVSYSIPAAFFILIFVMSLTKGRLYCNMICPAGTLFGLISKISLFRIRIDESACTRCGRCAVGCKSSCMDFLNHDVDVTRCVGCFNCINICQDKAVSYGLVRSGSREHITDERKRSMIAGSLLMLLGLPGTLSGQTKPAPRPKKDSTVRENRTLHVSPPGAGSFQELNKRCTACSLCINECPEGVLQPAFMQYGISGMMQPVMDYHKGFCTYNCTRCTEICPTYALHPLALEAKKLTQIGKVVFIKDNCIVKTEKTACGACSESCPTKAVYMVPYEGNLLIPEVNTDICIGCGHCEYSCPTTPYKAIFVDGNAVHTAARKPENVESEIKKPDEFPF